MGAVWKHEEVIKFCAGLMSNPTPLVRHMYELWIETNLDTMRSDGGLMYYDDLLRSLYRESKMQLPGNALHNPWINYCKNSEKTPIFIPSRFYGFDFVMEEVVCNNEHGREEQEEILECAVYIHEPDPRVAASILHACQTICQRQKITDLFIHRLECDDTTLTDVFHMSPNAQSLHVYGCDLPPDVMIHLLKQLTHCRQLTRLDLSGSMAAFDILHLSHLIQTNKLPELKDLNLSSNILMGELSGLVPHQGLQLLEELYLNCAALHQYDICHLSHLMKMNKLPQLKELYLWNNNLYIMQDELGRLIEACVTHHQRELELVLSNNNLSEEFEEKWEKRCEGTNIKLCFYF